MEISLLGFNLELSLKISKPSLTNGGLRKLILELQNYTEFPVMRIKFVLMAFLSLTFKNKVIFLDAKIFVIWAILRYSNRINK